MLREIIKFFVNIRGKVDPPPTTHKNETMCSNLVETEVNPIEFSNTTVSLGGGSHPPPMTLT